MSSDEQRVVDRQMNQAVEESLAAYGWSEDNLITTDVLVLVVQRGFEEDAGVSRVVMLQPTDTANHAVLGMLAEAKIDFEEGARMRAREQWSPDAD